MSQKISKSVKEVVYKVSLGQQQSLDYGWETMAEAVSRGFLTCCPVYRGDYALTDTGRAVANEYAASLKIAAAKRSAASRARSTAMKSVGMTRTQYGWE